jgi:deoxycytidine triphosphate deaminase
MFKFLLKTAMYKGGQMLNGNEIRQRKIIKNPVESSFRAASYDLTVGLIISPDENEPINHGSFIIPPQGMVEVISAERVSLPKNIAANTTLKNSLSSQGILSLSVGIIDPLYDGLISSTLVNFNKTPVPIRIGDAFMRVTFMEYVPEPNLKTPAVLTDDEYIRQRIRKVGTQFPRTFLDLENTVPPLTAPVVRTLHRRWRNALYWYIPIVALVLALLFGFLPFVIDAVAYRRAEYNNRVEQSTKMREDLSVLRQQVEVLRAQLDARSNSTTNTPVVATAPKHK